MMKKAVWGGALVLALASVGCSSVSPDAGTQAVLTYKPWFFGHGGVEPQPIEPGLTWVAFSTHADYVDLRPKRVDEQFDDLMTRDGVPLDFHAQFQYQVTNSVQLIQKFGIYWYAQNLQQPFRTVVRDAVKSRGLNEMAISASASAEVDAEVEKATQQLAKERSLPVTILGVSLGKANPPDSIKNQRIETATQEQRVITEQQRTLAERAAKDANAAKAEADAIYWQKMNSTDGRNMDTNQYLEFLDIQMKKEACQRGNCTFIVGGATPLVQTKQ